jgi:hypothetical protein
MKILIVGPQFFSYLSSISQEINRRGVPCSTYNELHSESIFSKIGYRLGLYFLYRSKIQSHRSKIYSYIDKNRITDVLFISPEIIDSEFLSEIKKKAKVHLYMWDGFENKKNALSVLNLFDSKASFDMYDSKKNDMNYIPLFAEEAYSGADLEKKYDLCFCGTIHSDRPKWIKEFQNFAKENNLKTGLFLYYYSPMLLFVRLLINRCCFDLFSKASYSSFSKEEIANLFKSSRAVIDITHPNQNGLTSRTFEALRSGSKLITNNRNCKMLEDEYHSRIFILDDITNQKKRLLEFIELEIKPLNEKQDYFLSIERFTDQLLESLND